MVRFRTNDAGLRAWTTTEAPDLTESPTLDGCIERT